MYIMGMQLRRLHVSAVYLCWTVDAAISSLQA